MKKAYKINSAAEMKKFGETFVGSICQNRKKLTMGALVIALAGELGAGKTQFAKGCALGLGIKQRINSPTFVICRSYKIPTGEKNTCPALERFFHIDCYRLRSAAEADAINIKKILADPKNIAVIEWPEIINSLLPKKTWRLRLAATGKNTRQVVF